MRTRGSAFLIAAAVALAVSSGIPFSDEARAAGVCPGGGRTVIANVVAIDQPIMFNRIGAQNVNGMVYALRRDVVDKITGLPEAAGGVLAAGNVELRLDQRPRPLVVRVTAGDCLEVRFQNLLAAVANPNNAPGAIDPRTGNPFLLIDEQVADRYAGFHPQGMQLVDGIGSDASYVGNNANSLVPPQGTVLPDTTVSDGRATYSFYAEREGTYLVSSYGGSFGSEGTQGNSSNGLFGAVNVEPPGAKIYRSQVTEEEMRLATTGYTPDGHPILNYEAVYPAKEADGVTDTVWVAEGKAGLPVLNMITPGNELVHSDLNAVIAGPNADGKFPPSTYPLESTGKRNPTVPNRLDPFREFTVVFHDEVAAAQAFPRWYNGEFPEWKYLLAGVKDGFMINYGSGGIGSEIIANRLGVGPMYDCLDCAFEEFFLTSFAVSDPASLVDIPANTGLEQCGPPPGFDGCDPAAMNTPKATKVLYPADPANIHHSYMNDHTKFRNVHVGKEQHVFHLHNHQWLFNPNDPDSNYLDAQGIGPGAGYTYEINFGGSGNRNKSAGDSIFHCHFYPHFAQGMWEHWRHHDVFEAGTRLAVTGDPTAPAAFHTAPFALFDGTPAVVGTDGAGNPVRARALPDGEVLAGYPIPALVPLPGYAMAPMPGRVSLVMKDADGDGTFDSSAAKVDRTDLGPDGKLKNPGYPFWIAGVDCGNPALFPGAGENGFCPQAVAGQRPPTPPLDMFNGTLADTKSDGTVVNTTYEGWDGGLPRHALEGLKAAGHSPLTPAFQQEVSLVDFSKEILRAKPVYWPEDGTDLETRVMEWHQNIKFHATYRTDGTPAAGTDGFRTNGAGHPGQPGAPFHEPCVDDDGIRLTGQVGNFFSAELSPPNKNTRGSSVFSAVTPRVYKATNIQFDAVFNKAGYHYPQERIVSLWEDAVPTINKVKPAEPLVMRLNTFDCAMFYHTNLVPKTYELDDYQVRTPTDIIGQHIHLPKWDLTTTDGSANGWNYEDGTLSPGAVRERIEAINHFNDAPPPGQTAVPTLVPTSSGRPAGLTHLVADPHPFFNASLPGVSPAMADAWLGARTTMQRWFTDPVVNLAGVDRGLGIIFTHDHYGPSTHQQIGLYATVLTEPAGSKWAHNETGEQLGYDPVDGSPAPGRSDGGPTSWQAQIIPPASAPGGSTVKSESLEPYREFYFEFSDFQHAYEAGVYVGAGQDGLALPGATPLDRFAGVASIADAFRFAINPPAREQITPVFPDLYAEAAAGQLIVCPQRPCPNAISVQDPGMLVVNYRNEPVGLRVYDPNRIGPDGKPGTQAASKAGDLAFALESRRDRTFEAQGASFGVVGPGGGQQVLNEQPVLGDSINGTTFPAPINAGGVGGGDPFTPMVRAYAGDLIRVKIQAGGHEEEHNASIHGMKWLQAGSGHGAAPTSGWRNAQAAGISEQFTFSMPVVPAIGTRGPSSADYLYTVDAASDGWWSGMWGIMRAYNTSTDLSPLPSTKVPVRVLNARNFNGVCPRTAPIRTFDITAVLANDVLDDPTTATGSPLDVTITPADPLVATMHEGSPLLGKGSLIYNPRATVIPPQVLPLDGGGFITIGGNAGPIHDPTAILYVRTDELVAKNPADPGCFKGTAFDPKLATCPVRLAAGAPVEPIVLRAAAGDCIEVTLRNKLPGDLDANGIFDDNPDLASYTEVMGVVKRDRFDPVGATTFQHNLVRPSSWVGLHPQLVSYDVTRGDGTNVGNNPSQTVSPGGTNKFQWYAGDISAVKGATGYTLVAKPVEFGGTNLIPADKIKQGAKSLVGTMVIEPQGATWPDALASLDTARDRQSAAPEATRKTRASATVTAPGQPAFRDFSVVIQKALTQHYVDGASVEHLNGEGVGIPEDSQDSSNMAMNYGSEPLWFRFALPPNAPFGHALGAGFGDVADSHRAYSNDLTGGQDPATPVFRAAAGQPFRMRVGVPTGSTRGTTFNLHGHVWQRAPYLAENANWWKTNPTGDPGLGSTKIGNNELSFYQGGQESITPYAHFDLVLPKAGGANAVAGDYLFRDQAGFGDSSGLWGILRVE